MSQSKITNQKSEIQVSQREKDIMILEDDIQRIHNKIEYDRSLTQADIIQKKKLLTELTADLKNLQNL